MSGSVVMRSSRDMLSAYRCGRRWRPDARCPHPYTERRCGLPSPPARRRGWRNVRSSPRRCRASARSPGRLPGRFAKQLNIPPSTGSATVTPRQRARRTTLLQLGVAPAVLDLAEPTLREPARPRQRDLGDLLFLADRLHGVAERWLIGVGHRHEASRTLRRCDPQASGVPQRSRTTLAPEPATVYGSE